MSPILPKFTVTLTAGQHGSVSGGGTYTQGTVITITAIPDSGYKFSSWSDGNTNASRQITVNSDINLSCVFEEKFTETWYFNKQPREFTYTGDINVDINFSSNNTDYTRISASGMEKYATMTYLNRSVGGHDNVWERLDFFSGEQPWVNDAYRTIILDEPASGDLLTFLQANATKIS